MPGRARGLGPRSPWRAAAAARGRGADLEADLASSVARAGEAPADLTVAKARSRSAAPPAEAVPIRGIRRAAAAALAGGSFELLHCLAIVVRLHFPGPSRVRRPGFDLVCSPGGNV